MQRIEDHQGPHYCVLVDQDIAIIQLTGNVFEIGANLDLKESFFATLEATVASADISAILLVGSQDVLSHKEYAGFMKSSIEIRKGKRKPKDRIPRVGNGIKLARHETALNQFIMKAVRLRKMLFIGLQGDIASPFLGASLTADYRFASEDVVFTPSHVKLGIAPSGALGFFLPRFVSQGKALELLLSDEPLPAEEALKLGLITKVIPRERYLERCVEAVSSLSRIPAGSAGGTKAVIHSYAKALAGYLENEQMVSDLALARLQAD
jgi:enoyl-CoA hydratase/carnithine racemase